MTSEEYRQKKWDDGVLAFKWLTIIALLVLLPLGFCAAALGSDPEYTPPEAKLRDWGTKNTMLLALSTGLDAMAAQQTRDCMALAAAGTIAACYETGILASALYGSRPTANEVWKFFALKTALKWFFAYQVDEPARTSAQLVFVGFSAIDVRLNQREGLKPDWGPLWKSLGLGVAFSLAF